MSPGDHEFLDFVLSKIASDPDSGLRFPSFYDPDHPSWSFRAGAFVIHYPMDPENGTVVFLNIFRRG